MAKRKKHPKLPNGYGCIRWLGPNRRNPYAVHPPTTEFTITGVPITPKALCYVNDWYKGFAVLTAYKAGTYYPGYEKTLSNDLKPSDYDFINKILADYSLTKSIDDREQVAKKTFADVYEEFYDWKFNRNKSRTYGEGSKRGIRNAYSHCEELHSKVFKEIRHKDMQNIVDACELKHSTKEKIVFLFKQMYKYAEINDLCDKNHAAHVITNAPEDDEHGVPFTDQEIRILWAHKEDPIAELLLILCYSGYRIGELKTITVNLEEMYFQGGLKSHAGKNRVVPIHSAIQSMVQERIKRDGALLNCTTTWFRVKMKEFLPMVNIEYHTPHDCRHTFSALCERYDVSENDRKRMLGHSFGRDMTNAVYGHRTLEDLRVEIEKIGVCY